MEVIARSSVAEARLRRGLQRFYSADPADAERFRSVELHEHMKYAISP